MTQVQADLNQALHSDEEGSPKIGWAIILFALILTLLSLLLANFLGVLNGQVSAQALSEGRIGQMIGATIAPILVSLFIVALFQLFKRFRNRRSRLKIYCWSLVVLCVSTLAQIVPYIAPATGAA